MPAAPIHHDGSRETKELYSRYHAWLAGEPVPTK